jgi:hypothetical protein
MDIYIPVEDTQWHRLGEEHLSLPKDHYAEYIRSGGDLIVRITGPNAHVTGNAATLETAIWYALEWFNAVGGEL